MYYLPTYPPTSVYCLSTSLLYIYLYALHMYLCYSSIHVYYLTVHMFYLPTCRYYVRYSCALLIYPNLLLCTDTHYVIYPRVLHIYSEYFCDLHASLNYKALRLWKIKNAWIFYFQNYSTTKRLTYFFTVLNVVSRDAMKRVISISIKIRTSGCLLMLYGGIMLAKAVLNCSLQSF